MVLGSDVRIHPTSWLDMYCILKGYRSLREKNTEIMLLVTKKRFRGGFCIPTLVFTEDILNFLNVLNKKQLYFYAVLLTRVSNSCIFLDLLQESTPSCRYCLLKIKNGDKWSLPDWKRMLFCRKKWSQLFFSLAKLTTNRLTSFSVDKFAHFLEYNEQV